jgi:phage shock protein E
MKSLRSPLNLTVLAALSFLMLSSAAANTSPSNANSDKVSNTTLSPAAAKAPVHFSTDLQILDVRTPEEFADNSLESSVNVDVTASTFKAEIQKLDKSKTYKLYCRSGKRSSLAEKFMREAGFKNVGNLGSLGEAAGQLKLPCRKTPCPK